MGCAVTKENDQRRTFSLSVTGSTPARPTPNSLDLTATRIETAGNSISKPSEFRTKLPPAIRGQVPELAVSLTIALCFVLRSVPGEYGKRQTSDEKVSQAHLGTSSGAVSRRPGLGAL